jgi:hypothetical protein
VVCYTVPATLRLGLQGSPGKNTLAYYPQISAKKKEMFKDVDTLKAVFSLFLNLIFWASVLFRVDGIIF